MGEKSSSSPRLQIQPYIHESIPWQELPQPIQTLKLLLGHHSRYLPALTMLVFMFFHNFRTYLA